MARTTPDKVKQLLGDNYDSCHSLSPFIDTATLLVDRVKSCASDKGKSLSSAELERIEAYLSAHFYTRMNPTLSSESTSSASGSYHGQTGLGLDGSFYGQTAKSIDFSGCLKAIAEGSSADFIWMGKPPSSQIAYENRD